MIDSRKQDIYDMVNNYEEQIEKAFDLTIGLKPLISSILLSFSTLNSRERKILVNRWGLFNGKTKTLRDVAKKFGITKERARQVERLAMKKLVYQSMEKFKELWKGYINEQEDNDSATYA